MTSKYSTPRIAVRAFLLLVAGLVATLFTPLIWGIGLITAFFAVAIVVMLFRKYEAAGWIAFVAQLPVIYSAFIFAVPGSEYAYANPNRTVGLLLLSGCAGLAAAFSLRILAAKVKMDEIVQGLHDREILTKQDRVLESTSEFEIIDSKSIQYARDRREEGRELRRQSFLRHIPRLFGSHNHFHQF